MISGKWYELKNRFVNIDLDEFVVTPNHFHGIIIINNTTGNDFVDFVGANLRVRPAPHVAKIICTIPKNCDIIIFPHRTYNAVRQGALPLGPALK